MADKSNDGSYQPRKSKKERVWTNAEMKYLALVQRRKNNMPCGLRHNLLLDTIKSSKKSQRTLRSLSDEFKEANEREKSKSKDKQKNSALD